MAVMTPASRPLRPAHRPASSAIPAFAGMLVAAAFAMGAFAFEVGAGSALEAVDPAPVVTVEPSITPSTTDVFVEPVPVVTPSLSAPRSGPMIALVIDDAGPDRLETLRAMALPVPVTLSILPYAEDAAALDEQARSLGHETFIHLPMEPEGLGSACHHTSPVRAGPASPRGLGDITDTGGDRAQQSYGKCHYGGSRNDAVFAPARAGGRVDLSRFSDITPKSGQGGGASTGNDGAQSRHLP